MKKLITLLFLFASVSAFSQAGASTASLQSVQNVKLDTIAARNYRTARAFDVSGGNGVFWSAGYPISTYISAMNTALNQVNAYLSGTLNIQDGSGLLATKANQAVTNTTLTNITTTLQALLNSTTTLNNSINSSTVVSGTVTANAGTGTMAVNISNTPTVNIYMGGSNYVIVQVTITASYSAAASFTAGNAISTSSTTTSSATSFTLPAGAWQLVGSEVNYANMNNTARLNVCFFTSTVQMSPNNQLQTFPPYSSFVGGVDYFQTGNTGVSVNTNGLPAQAVYNAGAANMGLPVYFQSGVTTFYMMPTIKTTFSTNGANPVFVFTYRFLRAD